MKNIGRVMWVVNNNMRIMKELVKAQSNLIDFLMKIVYSLDCKLDMDDEADITNLLADIKKVADQTKKNK